MANIAVGERFSAFILPDEQGEPFDLRSEPIEGPLMFVFYRGDWWPYCNGQLVSFARDYEDFEERKVRIAGISVDSPSRNAVMVDKLDLPFQLLSDPRGDLIKHCGLWNDEEGVSEPAIVALDKSGTVQYLYSGGADFADRPQEESLLYILDRVGSESDEEYGGVEPEIQISAEEAENETVRPDKPVLALEQLKPYYRGVYFATVSMKKKLVDEGLQGESIAKKVNGYQALVTEYNAAIQETIEAKAARVEQ
jgi:peroxiredoxin